MPRHVSLRYAVFLCGILLSLYLLVYVSAPESADGQALLVVAANSVQHRSPDIMTLGASEALLPEVARMGKFGAGDLLYAKKGPAPSLLLLPLVALADLFPWLSIRATAMLFNPMVTTLTALALYASARRLGYATRTALIAALLFGAATFALAYVKTLFGEPLAGLLLVTAAGTAYHYHQHAAPRVLVVAGTALGLAIGINFSYAVMGPIIGLYIFGWNPARWPLRRVIVLAAPVILAVLALGGYNWARFGSPFDSGYNFAAGEGFNRPFLYGVYGLLLSPYKGVFWYNPVLLLAIPGWFMLRRRDRAFAWMLLALIAAQVVTYAAWWSWHGGVVWGPRFLLPVTPLAVICLVPAVDRALAARAAWGRAALLLLGLLSVAVQLLGALYSYVPFYGYLLRVYGTGTLDGIVSGLDAAVMVAPEASPVIGHAALVIAGWDFEPAALSGSGDAIHIAVVLLLALASVIVLLPRVPHKAGVSGVALVALVSANVIVARQQRGAEHATVRHFEAAVQPPDTAVVAATQFGSSLIDVENGARVLPTNAPTNPDDTLVAGIWNYALGHSKRLWFVTWFPPGHADNWQERALWMQYPAIKETTFDGYRAVYFDLGAAPPLSRPGGWQFGPVALASYGMRVGARGVYFTAGWQATSAPERDYGWFVHLVDASGAIVAQQDRAPAGGYAPTSAWQVGETVRDRLHFPLPPGTDTTGWQLRIGFVDPQTGARLTAQTPDGAIAPDGYVLLPVVP